VEQLQGMHARFNFHQRDLEVQRLDDDGFEDGGIELAACEGTHRAQANLGQGAPRQPRELVRRPGLDPFRNVQSAVGRQALEQRCGERDWRRRAGGRDKAHGCYITRAPRAAIGET